MTVKLGVPFNVDNESLLSSTIQEPDPAVGEETWLSLEDRRDINILTFPPGAQKTKFGMYHDNSIHDNAIWFSVMDYGSEAWHMVGMDASFSLVFSSAVPKPTINVNWELCGFYLRSSEAHFAWWNSSSKELFISSAAISGTGSPSFNPGYFNFLSLSTEHTNNNGIRIFTSGLNEYYYVVASSSYTGIGVSDRVTSERICLLNITGNEMARKTFPDTQFGTITDIAMIGSLIYVTRISSFSDNPYVGEIYNLSLELVASSPLNKVVSGARFIGTSPNGTVNITDDQSNPSFEVLMASDFSPPKSYRIGDEVIYTPNGKKYYCTKDNSNEIPPDSAGLGALSEWSLVGSSNRLAMFDDGVAYSSLLTSNTTVVIEPDSPYDVVACLGLVGVDSVTIDILDQSNNVLYTETRSTPQAVDEFSDFNVEELIFSDIPPFIDTKVRVTINIDSSGDSKIGDLVIAKSYQLGSAVLGTQSDTKDYSAQEYDIFGNFSYIERPIVPYVTYQIDVKKENAIAVQRFVNSLRGKSNLWYADIGEAEFLTVYGRCETIPMTYENHSIVSYKAKVRGTI